MSRDLSDIKNKVHLLYAEMTRLEQEGGGDPREKRRQIEVCLNELASIGGEEARRFIEEISTGPSLQLDLKVYCNDLLRSFSHPKRSAHELKRFTDELSKAVWTGNKDEIELLIRKGADLNRPDEFNWIPLQTAAHKGNKELVEFLLCKGALVNAQGTHKTTALLEATKKQDNEIVKLLIEKGADINMPDYDGKTPLLAAIGNGNKELVEIILKHGAQTYKKIRLNAYTPMHVAVLGRHEDIVKLLLEYEADASSFDGFARTPLHHAIQMGSKYIVEILIESGVDINIKASQWNFPNVYVQTPLGFLKDFPPDNKEIEILLKKHGAVE